MDLDFNKLTPGALNRPAHPSPAATPAAGSPAPTPAAAYIGEALTISKREFPLPGEATDLADIQDLPEDTLTRDDPLGRLVRDAFNYPPPPPPPFTE